MSLYDRAIPLYRRDLEDYWRCALEGVPPSLPLDKAKQIFFRMMEKHCEDLYRKNL